MNAKRIEDVANAVMYEGYMLYPYRPSAVKNRQRWNFGVLYPRAYSEAQKGADAWFTQTQCLVRSRTSPVVEVKVRFLQAVSRQVGKLPDGVTELGTEAEPEFTPVDTFEVGSRLLQSWQESVEQNVQLSALRTDDLVTQPVHQTFALPAGRDFEPVKDDDGAFVGVIVRTRKQQIGSVEVSAERCGDGLLRLTIVIKNLTPFEASEQGTREDVLLQSLLSAHAVLGVAGGDFVSLIDPPAAYQQAASGCMNIGTWPVLVGEDEATDAMLSSPIILYDYPQIAPESPNNLFDGTEIDEILALRILTLSDDEKREIRRTDERTRALLDRTESLPPEHFLKLHGVLRGMKPPDLSPGPHDGDE